MNTTLQKEPRATGDSNNAARQFATPEVAISETQDGYVLTAEMPGVNKTGLDVTLEGAELTVVGHRTDVVPKAEPLFRESRSADFRRVFELDPAIDTRKIVAQMDQGVLTLRLPKAERVKPRKIEVTD